MTDRELDVLVAEKVMGFTERVVCYAWADRKARQKPMIRFRTPPLGASWSAAVRLFDTVVGGDGVKIERTHGVKRYSSDIGAAWEVVEKMPYRFSVLRGTGMGETFKAEFWIEDTGERVGAAYAPTAPRAICLAALRAVGVEA